MMFHAHAPLNLWVKTFRTATFTINRLPTPILDDASAFEVLYGRVPSYDIFHPFGCLCFPFLSDYNPYKFATRSVPCVFLGYSATYKGFQYFDCTSHRVYISRHVQFVDNIFPY